MYLFKNILGTFVFDKDIKLVAQGQERQLKTKYKDLKQPSEKEIKKILAFFKQPKYLKQFYQKNMSLTKKLLQESVNEDHLIIQTISNIEELDKSINLLSKRLREWYSLYFPEISQEIKNKEAFVEVILKKNKKQLMKELDIQESLGSDLSKKDSQEILLLAEETKNLIDLRNKHEQYLEKIMKKYASNLNHLLGVTLAAKLLEHAGSLKKLALFPSSTIQLLGAEKALFRHLKTGARPPKHGIIIQHQLVQKAKDKGKAARLLADKISMAARLDYFKGDFKAEELLQELKQKLNQND